jgi:polyisoprenoid-binding protein YceI
MKLLWVSSFVLAAWIPPYSRAQTPSAFIYRIDADRSRLELAVSRGGLLKMAGHDHAIAAKAFSGQVRFNSKNVAESSVDLSIETGSLIVLDPDAAEKDRKEIQATMEGAAVLNIRKYPRILFHSTGVSSVSATGRDFMLSGILNFHGVEKEIVFPVHIQPQNNLLRATGTASITQTGFGIKPVRAALGTIRVKDKIQVTFDFLAEKVDP